MCGHNCWEGGPTTQQSWFRGIGELEYQYKNCLLCFRDIRRLVFEVHPLSLEYEAWKKASLWYCCLPGECRTFSISWAGKCCTFSVTTAIIRHLRPLDGRQMRLDTTCGHLRPLAVTCSRRSLAVSRRSLAVTCSQRSLAVTCGHSSGCKWLQVADFPKIKYRAAHVLNESTGKKRVFQSHLKNLWKTRCLDLFFPRKHQEQTRFFSCREECNTDVHHCTMWPRIFQKPLASCESMEWEIGIARLKEKQQMPKYFSDLVLNICIYNSYTNKSNQNMLPLCVPVCH